MVSGCKTPYWMPGNFSNTMDDSTCLEHKQKQCASTSVFYLGAGTCFEVKLILIYITQQPQDV